MAPDRPGPGAPIGWLNGHPVATPAEKPVELDDPFDPVAMRVPFDDPEQGFIEAVRCFIEEYITMGYTDFMLLQMFRKPFYMGLYPVYERHGEEFVNELMADCRKRLARTGVYPRRSSSL